MYTSEDQREALAHAQRLVAALAAQGLRTRAWQSQDGQRTRVYLDQQSSPPQYVSVSRGGDVAGHDRDAGRGYGKSLTFDPSTLYPQQRRAWRLALQQYRQETDAVLEKRWRALEAEEEHERQQRESATVGHKPGGLFAAALARRAAERARGNPTEEAHDVVATRDTGNYEVEVRRKLDHPYWVAVRYTGAYGAGNWIEMDGGVDDHIDQHWVGENEEDDTPEADRLATAWLNATVRGDQDVELLLEDAGYDRYGNMRTRRNPDHPYLSLSRVTAWEARAAERGVSEVARSRRGFLTAYKRAGGRPAMLSEYWQRRREAFIARHMAQASNEQLWQNGEPSRRHLALIMWAYSPTPSRV